jgi:hypothetical protein
LLSVRNLLPVRFFFSHLSVGVVLCFSFLNVNGDHSEDHVANTSRIVFILRDAKLIFIFITYYR